MESNEPPRQTRSLGRRAYQAARRVARSVTGSAPQLSEPLGPPPMYVREEPLPPSYGDIFPPPTYTESQIERAEEIENELIREARREGRSINRNNIERTARQLVARETVESLQRNPTIQEIFPEIELSESATEALQRLQTLPRTRIRPERQILPYTGTEERITPAFFRNQSGR